MAIVNIMEDVVKTVIDQVISNDKNIDSAAVKIDDIAAYVLNRIDPRYVTGERGILHSFIENKQHTQKKTDILLLVYEAIDLIARRRNSDAAKSEIIHNKKLPHIVGEVLEETTFSTVSDIQITLLYNGTPACMIDELWANPCVTRKATKGYYHFWPEYNEELMGNKKHLVFTVRCEHSNFIVKEENIELDISDASKNGVSFVAPIILISAREGINLDFLYS